MPFPRHQVTIFILNDNFYPFQFDVNFINHTNSSFPKQTVMLCLGHLWFREHSSKVRPSRAIAFLFPEIPRGSRANLRMPTWCNDVEGDPICGWNSTLDYFDGTLWIPRLRSSNPIMTPKSTDDNLYLRNICDHRRPRLCGGSLDFEFIRECMKIYKISPKFHFWLLSMIFYL